MRKIAFLFLLMMMAGIQLNAQIRKIPSKVTTAFEKQYPTAHDVSYKGTLTNVQVHFVLDSIKMIAKYTNEGEWKETEKESNYDALPSEVKDGFTKSKFSNEWKVIETAIIDLPSGAQRYRLKIEKNDIQKKYLYFDTTGKLLRDALTL